MVNGYLLCLSAVRHNGRVSRFALCTRSTHEHRWRSGLGAAPGPYEWQFPRDGSNSPHYSRQLSGLDVGAMLGPAIRSAGIDPFHAGNLVAGNAIDCQGLLLRQSARWAYLRGDLEGVSDLLVLADHHYASFPDASTEHLRALRPSLSDELTSSRNVVPSRLERLLFGLHDSYLHLDHHLYPRVPFYNLLLLHDVLREVAGSNLRKGESILFHADR